MTILKNILPSTTTSFYDHSNDEEEVKQTTKETKAAIDKILNVVTQSGDSKCIMYKPTSQHSVSRIIKMVEKAVDPLEPPKFKHKKIPKRSGGSPPVPVMHSPPRAITLKDQENWKIPPCISNWNNLKGYTIPLHKRLVTDGRGLQEVQISDKFAKVNESLDVAVRKAREALLLRSDIQKEIRNNEKERKEKELRALSRKYYSERRNAAASMPVSDEFQREKIREDRRREKERERRLEAKDAAMGKKSKITRDRDRDISEKVALGMASTGGKGGEVMYDQRLFNQEKGTDSGFVADDQYNVYEKGLFTARSTLSMLYKPNKDTDEEMYGNAEKQLDKLSKKAGKRERPVEFEKEEEQDPFGLDRWVHDLKKGKKLIQVTC